MRGLAAYPHAAMLTKNTTFPDSNDSCASRYQCNFLRANGVGPADDKVKVLYQTSRGPWTRNTSILMSSPYESVLMLGGGLGERLANS